MLRTLPRLPSPPAPLPAAAASSRLRLVGRLAIAAGAGVCALALLAWPAHAADGPRDGSHTAGGSRSGTIDRDIDFQ